MFNTYALQFKYNKTEKSLRQIGGDLWLCYPALLDWWNLSANPKSGDKFTFITCDTNHDSDNNYTARIKNDELEMYDPTKRRYVNVGAGGGQVRRILLLLGDNGIKFDKFFVQLIDE